MISTPTVFKFTTLEELEYVSQALLGLGSHNPIWLFSGNMGAGKTTLIKAICKELGVDTAVHSPTFSIVNEYITVSKSIVYHFDFYRIRDETEALDIGVEEYFDSGNLCLIEWPEKIETLWPPTYLLLNLNQEESGDRILKVEEVKLG